MMLHHLTQLGGLGCLPACYNREREREIPPVNNGTCAFMSALCLRVNFENVWSCVSPPSAAPSSRSVFTPSTLPLLSPQLFTLLLQNVERVLTAPSLMPLIALPYQSHVMTGMPPQQQHLVVSCPACLLWATH